MPNIYVLGSITDHLHVSFITGAPKSGAEVDFILYGGEGFWAIEVKNAAKVHKADIRALKIFYEDYPECTPLCIYQGKEKFKIGKKLLINNYI